jgi:DNA-binding IclR family transcriptional regulator
MGRKINLGRLSDVLETIRENDCKVRANDVAKKLNLHPQAVTRLLPAFGEETDELLYEDDKGFLGIFKR